MPKRIPRTAKGWLKLRDVTRNNLRQLAVSFPLGVFTSVTGVSGSGKSSLVSQVLVELVAERLGQSIAIEEPDADDLEHTTIATTGGEIVSGMEHIGRLVLVTENASRFEIGSALVHMKVRTANVGGGDLDDHIVGLRNSGVRNIIHADVAGSVVNDCLHGSPPLLIRRGSQPEAGCDRVCMWEMVKSEPEKND
jgi:energy-coupling factor transporter ATP-binding protein EcfA2